MKLLGTTYFGKKTLTEEVGVGHQVTGPPEYKDGDGWVMGALPINPHNLCSLACP
jgi:hypothetical protein